VEVEVRTAPTPLLRFPPNTMGTEEVISSSCPEFTVMAWVEPAVTAKPGTALPLILAPSTRLDPVAAVDEVEPLPSTVAVVGMLMLVWPEPVPDPPPPPHAAKAADRMVIIVNSSFMMPPWYR